MQLLEKSSDSKRRYTLGVVYEPDSVDSQNEFAKAEEIEAAAWGFMARLQGLAKSACVIIKSVRDESDVEVDVTDLDELIKSTGLDDEHMQLDDSESPLGTIVESFITPTDLDIDGEEVKKGSWLLGVVWSPEMFERIEKGERTGLSMFGFKNVRAT